MADSKLPSLFNRHWAESALAIGAVVIAAVSLWVGYDTMQTNRQLVAAASWPFLKISESDITPSGRSQLTLMAVNAGIGPAKIESVELRWHGKAYRSSLELLRACCSLPRNPAQAHVSYIIGTLNHTVVRAGQTVNLLRVPNPAQDPAVWSPFHAILLPSKPDDGLKFRICYCSAFNECWITNGRRLNPPRVKACPVPKVPFEG